MEKDYSLLRPFDLEAAKRGDTLVDPIGIEGKYVAGPHPVTREIVVEFSDRLGFVVFDSEGKLCMAPLVWVEGKPVYKGDVLWNKIDGKKYTVTHFCQSSEVFQTVEERSDGVCSLCIESSTCIPPKVKREVKLLAWLCDSCLCWTTEDFPVNKGYVRVPSEDKVIEIEESILKIGF